MASRRSIKAVLTNLLGTLLSRNSNSSGGFWLLGVAEPELSAWRSDLLREPHLSTERPTPIDELSRLSARRFREQLDKAEVPLGSLASAEIWVTSVSAPEARRAGDTSRQGRVFWFAASAVTITGQRYLAEDAAFVVPHDPTLERSRRPTQGT